MQFPNSAKLFRPNFPLMLSNKKASNAPVGSLEALERKSFTRQLALLLLVELEVLRVLPLLY